MHLLAPPPHRLAPPPPLASFDHVQIKAHDHVVVVQRVHEDFCVKIVGVDETGKRIRRM